MKNETRAFKTNLGFASMLFGTVNETYRYYVSTNHLLFDRAFTITRRRDMTTRRDMTRRDMTRRCDMTRQDVT